MQSHSCVLGSWLVCLVGQLHAFPVLFSGFLSDLSYGSTACAHSCDLGSCLLCFNSRLILLCRIFLSALSQEYNSRGQTLVSWVFGLVCLMNEIHAVTLLCPGILSGLSSVFGVKFLRSHSCVLGSCLVCLMGQLHAVYCCVLGSCLSCFLGQNSCGHIPVLGLSQEYNSRGLTPVFWVLVWFVFGAKFMRSYSCVLGSCLVCLLNEIHAVPLLCPGFLAGLSFGSTSCVPSPVVWLLV